MTALEPDFGVDPAASVTRLPDGLAERYGRLALISHPDHLAAFTPDMDILLVSSDWQTVPAARRAGFACVHAECLLETWPGERGDPATAHLVAGNWVDLGGVDGTLFKGVSLGRLFLRSVATFDNAFVRYWHALCRLVDRFRPEEIVLVALRAEFDLLTPDLQRALAEDVAARAGARLVMRADPRTDDANQVELPVGVATAETEPAWKTLARQAFTAAVALAFRLRPGRRRHVLLMVNWVTAKPLLEAYAGGEAAPAAFAAMLSKSPSFLWWCWRRGVRLMHLPMVRLDAHERAELAAIRQRYEDAWRKAPGDVFERARRNFIRQAVFDSGWFESMAVELKRHLVAFRRTRLDRIVVGDITNSTSRVMAEAARRCGAKVDELPNGMYVTPQRYDARSGDHLSGPLLDRMLSWGGLTEAWMASAGIPAPAVRVGYPALEPFRRLRRTGRPNPADRSSRVLVLPVYVDCDDTPGLRANIQAYLVDTLRALTKAGYTDLRIKLHPAMPNPRYYAGLLEREGLSVPLFVDGGLTPHMEWADLVVGPPNSGSLTECLAAGRPYYALCPEPSLVDRSLLGRMVTVDSGAQLVRCLEAGVTPDMDAILEDYCSWISIPDAAARFWEIMDATGPGRAY